MTPSTRTHVPAGPSPLPTVDEFLGQIARGDAATALARVADHMRSGGVVTEVVAELLAPAQREVGERWHAGTWSVADEHAASAVVEDALGLLAAHLPRSSGTQRLVLVCAEGEWHTTPARMAALTLRDAGWHVDFLGGSTPAEHLRAALAHTRPTVLAVSATLPLSLPGVRPVVDVAHDLDVPVLVGGRAFDDRGHRALMVGADGHARDLSAGAAVLTSWLDAPPTRRLVRPDPDLRREHGALAVRHDDLVAAAFRLLERRVPQMRDYTPAQVDHTRRDLAFTLRFLEAALVVEDRGLFTEYAAWLATLLDHRGVPPDVLRASFDALAEAMGGDMAETRAMLATDVAV